MQSTSTLEDWIFILREWLDESYPLDQGKSHLLLLFLKLCALSQPRSIVSVDSNDTTHGMEFSDGPVLVEQIEDSAFLRDS